MRISIQTGRARSISRDLSDLSKRIRHAGGELDDVRRALSTMTEMDQCRHKIQQQSDAAALLAGQLAGLANALEDVAGIYDQAENRNTSYRTKYPGLNRASSVATQGGTARQMQE